MQNLSLSTADDDRNDYKMFNRFNSQLPVRYTRVDTEHRVLISLIVINPTTTSCLTDKYVHQTLTFPEGLSFGHGPYILC